MTPAVYLHGFASSPASSKARYFRDRLTSLGIPVTIPDLGQPDFARLTITAQLDILDHAACPGPVDLVGSSMGGWLAALFAARYPDRVRRLVLLAPALGFNRRWPERLGPEEMDRWRATDSLAVFHYGENRVRAVGYQLVEDAARYPDFPDFRQLALVFHGIHDDIVPARYSEEFADGRPNIELRLLDSGHDLQPTSAPVPSFVSVLRLATAPGASPRRNWSSSPPSGSAAS